MEAESLDLIRTGVKCNLGKMYFRYSYLLSKTKDL